MKMCVLKFQSVLAGLLGLSITCPTYAADTYQSINEPRTILEMRTYLNYSAIRVDPAFVDTVGCGGTVQGLWIVVDWSTSTDNKAMYNAALSAFLLNKPITFGVKNDCNYEFGSGTSTTYRIDMLNTP